MDGGKSPSVSRSTLLGKCWRSVRTAATITFACGWTRTSQREDVDDVVEFTEMVARRPDYSVRLIRPVRCFDGISR